MTKQTETSEHTAARTGGASEAASGWGFLGFLRVERIGGMILLGAAVAALLIANSPLSEAYQAVLEHELGVGGLRLDVAHWISEGLLAVFFLVVGLEVKRELVAGELSSRAAALLPVCAAVGGMLVPAGLYILIAGSGGGAWAIPTATDIAFALGVLAVAGSHAPTGLRVLLLSLAVVDDLGAILIIAVVFSSGVSLGWLAGAGACVGSYLLLQRAGVRGWGIIALGALLGTGAWISLHEAGVHATIAGVMMGLATRVGKRGGEEHSPGEQLEHALQPWSAGVIVPLYAFSAAGVVLSLEAASKLASPVALGILLGLVVGKVVGILAGSFIAVRTGAGRLPAGTDWWDVGAVGLLAGCGFTVSLLIAGLALEGQTGATAVLAVLVASVVAGALGAGALRWRGRGRGGREDVLSPGADAGA